MAYSADDRRRMAANGQAMPDGSYPIANATDLASAIRLVGQGNASNASIRRHIIKRAKALGLTDRIPDNWTADGGARTMTEDLEGVVYRALAEPMQFPEGDGLTVSGYAAVFNQRAHISDRLGEYDEVIKPGAFKRSITARSPMVMFQHGRHPLFGPYPLGRLTELREDDHGLFYSLRVTDTWLTSPIREAIKERAVTGSSISFEAPRGKADFSTERDGTRLRTVREAKLFELGPVVGPAYEDTSVMIRSALHGAEDAFPEYFAQERIDVYARLAILEERAGVDLTQPISDTSEEPALDERTSDEPVDEPGTSDPEPAEERADTVDADEPSLDRRHQVWRIEMQRRGIRAEGK